MRTAAARRSLAITVTAAVIIIVCVMLLLEVGLHTVFYLENGYLLFAGQSNFKIKYVKPVRDRRQYSLQEGAVVDQYTINSRGFRGPVRNPDDDRPAICVLGDSVPFGAGVGDDSTFSVRLQEKLDRQGYRYFVLNAGVPSYNLRQSLDR